MILHFNFIYAYLSSCMYTEIRKRQCHNVGTVPKYNWIICVNLYICPPKIKFHGILFGTHIMIVELLKLYGRHGDLLSRYGYVICSVCHNYNPVLSSFMIYHRVCYKGYKTGATSGVGTVTLPDHLDSSPVFSGVRVAQSLVFCVMLCISLLVPLSFFSCDHYIVCPSIYGFWLPTIHQSINQIKIYVELIVIYLHLWIEQQYIRIFYRLH